MASSRDAQQCNGRSHQVLASKLIDLDNLRADLVTHKRLACYFLLHCYSSWWSDLVMCMPTTKHAMNKVKFEGHLNFKDLPSL